ncbi:MAG: transglycosylase domain-containing protein [Bacteroidaceae bacterium]|nr:transglycosylase domain-containing protein [Bacteroidaceae bacterium]
MRKKFFICLWTLFFLTVATVGGAFYLISTGAIGYMPDIEQLQNPVDKYASQVLSDDGELLGTWSYSRANRVFVNYDELSPYLVQALVATEDERFYEHSGVDFRALFRAVVKRGLFRQKSAGGGSTITQQLAKQLYSEKASNVMERLLQKPIEWVIAVNLERYYTKQEIITLYLNYFDFLHNAVGIKTAAKTYFNKLPKDLTINESAVLIGMCKNPSYYNPRRYPERAKFRRNTVLQQMERAQYLTSAVADSCKADTLLLNFHVQDHKDGNATYLREYLRVVLTAKEPVRSHYASWQGQKFYEDSLAWQLDPLYGWCEKNINPKTGRPYDIYQDGLKVYTAIDSRMQRYAEEAAYSHVMKTLQPLFDKERRGTRNAPYGNNVDYSEARQLMERAKQQSGRYVTMKAAGYTDAEINDVFNNPVEMTVFTTKGERDTVMTPMDSIRHYRGFLRTGFVCMDNERGYVKAYVGGVDYAHFQYDMASQGRRQVGSTIKPYLYAMAMENGWSPCDVAPNEPRTYMSGGKPWTPRNSSKSRVGEMVTLQWALAQSNNWVSAYLLNQLSPALLVKYIHRFGVKNRDIDAVLPLCLGTCDVSVLEMVTAYTAFPKGGTRCQPVFVTKIVDSDGKVVANLSDLQVKKNPYDENDTRDVLSEDAAYKMITLMQGVINSGTGQRMRSRYGLTCDMAGKTGTTNDNSDGWFVGYTPRLTFGAWVGGEERKIHFNSMANGQGASSALPIAALFLKKVFADPRLGYSPYESFTFPADFDVCGSGVMDDGDKPDDNAEEEEPGFVESLLHDLLNL